MQKLNSTSVFLALAFSTCWSAPADEQSAAALYKTSGSFGLRITVEVKRNGAVRMVSPQSEFRNGDQIRLHFVSNLDGFVYALNETPSGETRVIFPTAEAGSNNMIRKSLDYTIPATNGWFRMVGPAGAEKLLMILSPRAMPEMEGRLQTTDRPSAAATAPANPTIPQVSAPSPAAASPKPAAANQAMSGGASNSTVALAPSDGQPVKAAADPNASGGAVNSTSKSNGSSNGKSQNPMNTASQSVGAVRSGVSLITSAASIPSSLAGLGSRDLVFEDDVKESTAYVSAKPEGLTGPVIFSIALVHR